MERGALDALPLLSLIVFEQESRLRTQFHYGHEVTECDEAHEEIANAPHEVEAGQRSEEHHHDAVHDAHEGQPTLPRREKLHVHLAVGVVADDRREGKEEDGYSHKIGAGRSHLALQGGLGELYAIEVGRGENSADNDDEGRARADENRVGEDAQRLHQSLLHGMGDAGDAGRTGC